MKLLITLAMAIVLAGCSIDQASRTLSVVSSAANVKYYYDNGDAVNFVGNAELTSFEAARVLEALERIDNSKKILKAYEDDLKSLVLNIDAISYEYSKIKASYLDIRTVVLSNIDEYQPSEIRTFIEFDDAARHLDQEFSKLVDAVEANATINTAIRFADTVIKIGSIL